VCLGEFEFKSGFNAGEEPSHDIVCGIIFFLASFLLCVHMMNMLIAIMGDTFIKNQVVETQLLLKGKLKFVVDNWWIKNALGEDKYRIKYIIAALISENEDDGNDIVNKLYTDFE